MKHAEHTAKSTSTPNTGLAAMLSNLFRGNAGRAATPSISHNLDGTRAPSRGRAVLCFLTLIAPGAAFTAAPAPAPSAA